jgi:hypothetical protein
MNVTVKHNQEEQLFYADINGERAELAYELPQENVIDFTHTYVPEGARGEGIAEQLAKTAVAYADDNNYRIIPSCRFVKQYLHRQHR